MRILQGDFFSANVGETEQADTRQQHSGGFRDRIRRRIRHQDTKTQR